MEEGDENPSTSNPEEGGIPLDLMEQIQARIDNGDLEPESDVARAARALRATERAALRKGADARPRISNADRLVKEADSQDVYHAQSDYNAFKKQDEFHNSEARFRIVIAGVRGGKTKAGGWEMARHALETINGHGWIVSPTYKLLQLAVDDFMCYFEDQPDLIIEQNKAERWIRLVSGTKIEFRSAEWPDQLRAAGLDFVWLDEASFMKPEVERIIRTRTSDKLGRVWITTTPKGKNWVYKWYLRGLDPKRKDYQSFKWTSRDNPYFPSSEWADAKADLPADFFAQEYAADFLDDVAGVFRGVNKIIAKRYPAEATGPFSLGLDLAKHQDWTVITVMDSEGKEVDWYRFQKLSWPEQKEQIIRVANKWEAIITMDSTGIGDPIYDDLVVALGTNRVKAIVFTSASKANLIRLLQTSIEKEEIRIKENDILVEELKWFEYHLGKTGNVSFSAPQGMHDDCVVSLALSNWGRVHTLIGSTPVILDFYGDDGIEPEEENPDDDEEVFGSRISGLARRENLVNEARMYKRSLN